VNPPIPRVVPTLTEVLDEAVWQPAPAVRLEATMEPVAPAALDEAAVFAPMPAPDTLPAFAAVTDFELDLGDGVATPVVHAAPFGPVPAFAAPPGAPPRQDELWAALETGLQQRLSLAVDLAVDELLQTSLRESLERATAQLTESLMLDVRQQIAPQLEALVQEALREVLRQERARISG
jgi:hypothetical protein